MKETDIARDIIAYLGDLRWDVYQEVKVRNRRIDIVAVQNGLIWAIETKLSRSLHVIEQAYNWIGHANYVSIGVVGKGNSYIFNEILRRFGIGSLSVGYHVIEDARPALRRRISPMIKDRLNERQKDYAEAGNSEGKFWSPFKATCDSILKYVRSNQGATLQQIIANVNTHYSMTPTAKSCIRSWADRGSIPGIRMERENRMLKFYAD